MFSTQSLDRLLTFLGIFCRDELRRDGIPCASPFGDHELERDYLARHGVPLRLISQLSGRDRFDELANRIRDYPGSLPATVQENREAFDEIRTVLHSIETDTKRPEPEVWQRLESLRAQIQDGAIRARSEADTAKAQSRVNPTLTESERKPFGPKGELQGDKWCFENGKVHVPPRLQEPLKAYLDGRESFDALDWDSDIRKLVYHLAKIIGEGRALGFQPHPGRWPRASDRKGMGKQIQFNKREGENSRNTQQA